MDRRNFLVGALTTGVAATAEPAVAQAVTPRAHPERQQDWLIDATPFRATIKRTPDGREITLENGLLRRVFRLKPNAATVALENLMTGEGELRSVRPEAVLTLNDMEIEVGGLDGAPVQNFFQPEWLEHMTASPRAFQLERIEEGRTVERFPWKKMTAWMSQERAWPPPGVALKFEYRPGVETPVRDVRVRVCYELYDGLPLMAKWLEVENAGAAPVTVNAFKAEVLAVVESYATRLADTRPSGLIDKITDIHVETDYAFGGNMSNERDNPAVHWKADPQYHGGTLALLECSPEVGPELDVAPGGTWRSFTVFELVHDSKDAERRGLAMRRMMATIAPWVTENPIYMHSRFSEPDKVKLAIDQCADVGFEMVMLSFGSGFNIEDTSPAYLAQMKSLADYAKQKGIAIGGYSLLASRGGKPEDLVVDVKTGRPGGGKFGPSPCLGTKWAENYFKTVSDFLTTTGMNVFENDGSYPGDYCASTKHPGHKGYLDSQWRQWETICRFYRWCRAQGVYLTVPDWYFLNGSSKTGMGYTENDWSLPREFQPLIERQDIYDGTWEKTPTMGWMHVPLVEYHGGGGSATVEPLEEHLAHYEQRLADLLGAGVQATWRGERLYDTDKTRAAVKRWLDFYKANRAILESDIIHLRRPDGADWDGILHVNPGLAPCGMAFLYNPLSQPIERTVELPLYYTGLSNATRVTVQDSAPKTMTLDREFKVSVPVRLPALGSAWVKLELT